MKISEQLSEIKRKEGELQRLISMREQILDERFTDSVIITDSMEASKIEELKRKFFSDKTIRYMDITKKITNLTIEIIELKNKINKLNVQIGIDKKLMEIKYIRLELARLMKYLDKTDYLGAKRCDIDFNQLIKELEDKKSKLDAEIQYKNWNTDC